MWLLSISQRNILGEISEEISPKTLILLREFSYDICGPKSTLLIECFLTDLGYVIFTVTTLLKLIKRLRCFYANSLSLFC